MSQCQPSGSIAVVYGVDNRFVVPLAASIESAVANVHPKASLDIHVIDGGISRRNRSRIERLCRERGCSLVWLRPEDKRLASLKVGGAITVATYYRLLIEKLLPELARAIYLDADLIVEGDLAKLWEVPFEGHHIAAVQDQGIRLVSGPFGLTNYRELGIPAGAKYFNAGVLVLNLEKWREDRTADTVLSYLRENHSHIRFHDQDALNAVLWGRWVELDPRWNQMPQILQVARFEDSPFDSETFERVRTDPFIVHYASADKPWRVGCRHPAVNRFFFYLDRTVYRGLRPSRWRERISDMERTGRIRFKRLLRRVAKG